MPLLPKLRLPATQYGAGRAPDDAGGPSDASGTADGLGLSTPDEETDVSTEVSSEISSRRRK